MTTNRPKYVDRRQIEAIAGVSRSHVIRHILPRITRYSFGPRCVRYREDEVYAALEAMAGAA